jgi:hypothetical protein
MLAIFFRQLLYDTAYDYRKQKQGFAQRLCVILMMASAIHSNVRNLGLFVIYDKVGISK